MVRFTDIAVITPDDRSAQYDNNNNQCLIIAIITPVRFQQPFFSPKTISRFVAKLYLTYLVTDVIPFADNNNSVVNFFNYSHNYTREELNMV